MLCHNLTQKETELLTLQHIPFLRILARKFWSSSNLPFQNDYKLWTILPKTKTFCRNVPKFVHVCALSMSKKISLPLESPPGIGLTSLKLTSVLIEYGSYSKICPKRTCSKRDSCLKRTKGFAPKYQFTGQNLKNITCLKGTNGFAPKYQFTGQHLINLTRLKRTPF